MRCALIEIMVFLVIRLCMMGMTCLVLLPGEMGSRFGCADLLLMLTTLVFLLSTRRLCVMVVLGLRPPLLLENELGAMPRTFTTCGCATSTLRSL